MAKNMQDTTYRRLDIDAYDPEKYVDDDGAETPGLGPDESSILSMLSTNRFEDALHTAIQNPPLKTKNQALKDKATLLVAKVLGSFKPAEIEGVVKNLSGDQGDVVMKYVYRAMELQPESALCQTLLAWHAQLVAKFGLGSIIRVFSDRHRV